MNYAEIICNMTLEQKCALLSGAGTFQTRALPQYGIRPSGCPTAPTVCASRRGRATIWASTPANRLPVSPLHRRWQPAGTLPWGRKSAKPSARKPPLRTWRWCWGPGSTPSAALCAGVTLNISPRTPIFRAKCSRVHPGHPAKWRGCLSQTFCRQQPGTASYGHRFGGG